MKDKKHQKEVEQTLKQSLKRDKARVTVGHLSKFGLLELSRQRLRPTAAASAYHICPTCQGRGSVKSVEVLSLGVLRQISSYLAQNPVAEVRAAVPLEAANFLLNQKRRELLALEELHHVKIILLGKEHFTPGEIQVEYLRREAGEAAAPAEAGKKESSNAQ
jgi:ribonuclease E